MDSDYIACGGFNIEDTFSLLTSEKHTENKPITDSKSDLQDSTPYTIKDIKDKLFDALCSHNLIIPKVIRESPSNLTQTKHFDQIGYHQYSDSTITFVTGGVIDFVGAVYKNDSKLEYKLTDHLPMWAVFSSRPDENPKYINP